jgi:hypothetical protein
MKRKLAEQAAQLQEAERQAKKKAAVEQYRRERELFAARQREVSAVLAERERHAGIDEEAARDRAEYHIQLAADKRKAMEQAAGTGRSERLLMAADRARKLSAVLKPEQSEAVAQRLYGSVTASQQVWFSNVLRILRNYLNPCPLLFRAVSPSSRTRGACACSRSPPWRA